MIVKLTPASADHRVWQVAVDSPNGPVPVDYTTLAPEQRSFIGDAEGYVEAAPDADGWDIKHRLLL